MIYLRDFPRSKNLLRKLRRRPGGYSEGGEEGEEQPLRDTFISLFNFPRGTYLILPCLFTCLSTVSLLEENRDLANPVQCLISSSWNSAWCMAGRSSVTISWMIKSMMGLGVSFSQLAITGCHSLSSFHLPLSIISLPHRFFNDSPCVAR